MPASLPEGLTAHNPATGVVGGPVATIRVTGSAGRSRRLLGLAEREGSARLAGASGIGRRDLGHLGAGHSLGSVGDLLERLEGSLSR